MRIAFDGNVDFAILGRHSRRKPSHIVDEIGRGKCPVLCKALINGAIKADDFAPAVARNEAMICQVDDIGMSQQDDRCIAIRRIVDVDSHDDPIA